MKTIFIRLLFLVAVVVALSLGSTTINAATTCETVSLNPTSGDIETVFTVIATNCEVNTGYIANVYKDGSGISSIQHPSTGAEGSWEGSIGTFGPGNYELRFSSISNPSAVSTFQFSVTDAPVETAGTCGQAIPAGVSITCPVGCPKLNIIGNDVQEWCSCGGLNQKYCPPNNALNRTECENELTREGDYCRRREQTGIPKYYCGEMIHAEDADNFECVGCPATILDEPGPNGERYWCACGGNLNLCCTPTGADQCEGACNTKPGLSECDGGGYACKGGTCVIPTNPTLAFCSGEKAIFTAIGCIPVDTVTRFSAFFVTWGLAIGGGIAMLTLVASSFLIMTSSGDLTKLQAGKEMLISSITGILFLVFCMFLLRVIGINVFGLFA